MVTIRVDYEGELHCVATHLPSGRRMETDAPVDNQGKGESFSPTDLVATALGTCMATVMGIAARKMRVELSGLRIEVDKEMTAEPPRQIRRLAARIWMPMALSEDRDGRLAKAAEECPVHRSLHPSIEKSLTFYWKDGGSTSA